MSLISQNILLLVQYPLKMKNLKIPCSFEGMERYSYIVFYITIIWSKDGFKLKYRNVKGKCVKKKILLKNYNNTVCKIPLQSP